MKKVILLVLGSIVLALNSCGGTSEAEAAAAGTVKQADSADQGTTETENGSDIIEPIDPPDDFREVVKVEEFKEYPDYYDDMVEEYITKVNEEFEAIGDHGFAFCFVTDQHVEHNSGYTPSIIKDIYDATPLKYVLNGGDFYDRDDTKEGALEKIHGCVKEFEYLDVPLFVTLGNHDLNDNANTAHEDAYLTMPEFYEQAMMQMGDQVTYYDRANGKFNYYYYDPDSNTYLVCIQTGVSKLDSAHANFKDTDAAVLKDLLPTLDGNVIIFTHLLNNWKGEFEHVSTWTRLLNAINESGCSDKVKLVVSGHTHLDQAFDSEGVLHVITTTNSFLKREETEGTTDELAFDTYFVDYEKGTVKTLRFGRGEDRSFTIPE